MYIHELENWPYFTWDTTKLSSLLAEARYMQGQILGKLTSLGFKLREEATLYTLTQDATKTSEIEGEKFNAEQVRSSIAKRLGIEFDKTKPVDRNIEGIVDVLMDATQNYAQPLTAERLFGWHNALFPTGRSGMSKITVGSWRTEASGPMQVVSGPIGNETIHYEAPSYERLQNEMRQFIKWFNGSQDTDPVLKSAIAHFWFVTIHPFDDGNGRIARALADMLLAQCEKSKQRFYSMSAQIQKERNAYYDILESSQKGTLDITPWLEWYLNCFKRAILASNKILAIVLNKAKFWRRNAEATFNARQRAIINRLLDGFEGKLNSSKWAKLTKCSQDTALRDITDLLNRGILVRDEAGGRSTSYHLNPEQ